VSKKRKEEEEVVHVTSTHDKDCLLSPGELARWTTNLASNKFAICHVCLRAWRRVPGRRYFETSPRMYKYHASVRHMYTAICPECAQSEESRWSRICVQARNDRGGKCRDQRLFKTDNGLE